MVADKFQGKSEGISFDNFKTFYNVLFGGADLERAMFFLDNKNNGVKMCFFLPRNLKMRMFEGTYFKMGKKKSALMKMRPEIQVNREEFREVANWVVGAEVDRHVIEVRTGGAIVIIIVM